MTPDTVYSQTHPYNDRQHSHSIVKDRTTRGEPIGGVHGSWPGIGPGQLFDDADVAVKTDFRRVLSEILIRRMGNNHLGYIFPDYTDYQPLGIVSGTDIPPDYSTGGDGIFADDFESGDTGVWSTTSP